jgi:hypothetical protein
MRQVERDFLVVEWIRSHQSPSVKCSRQDKLSLTHPSRDCVGFRLCISIVFSAFEQVWEVPVQIFPVGVVSIYQTAAIKGMKIDI